MAKQCVKVGYHAPSPLNFFKQDKHDFRTFKHTVATNNT